MALVRSLDGRVFEIDEQTLEKFRIPDQQVKELAGNYTLPPARPERQDVLPGIDVQLPEALKGLVSVKRGPGDRIVINVGPGLAGGDTSDGE